MHRARAEGLGRLGGHPDGEDVFAGDPAVVRGHLGEEVVVHPVAVGQPDAHRLHVHVAVIREVGGLAHVLLVEELGAVELPRALVVRVRVGEEGGDGAAIGRAEVADEGGEVLLARAVHAIAVVVLLSVVEQERRSARGAGEAGVEALQPVGAGHDPLLDGQPGAVGTERVEVDDPADPGAVERRCGAPNYVDLADRPEVDVVEHRDPFGVGDRDAVEVRLVARPVEVGAVAVPADGDALTAGHRAALHAHPGNEVDRVVEEESRPAGQLAAGEGGDRLWLLDPGRIARRDDAHGVQVLRPRGEPHLQVLGAVRDREAIGLVAEPAKDERACTGAGDLESPVASGGHGGGAVAGSRRKRRRVGCECTCRKPSPWRCPLGRASGGSRRPRRPRRRRRAWQRRAAARPVTEVRQRLTNREAHGGDEREACVS